MGALALLLPVAVQLISALVTKMAGAQAAANGPLGPDAIAAYLNAGMAIFPKVEEIIAAMGQGSTVYDQWTTADFEKNLTPPTWQDL